MSLSKIADSKKRIFLEYLLLALILILATVLSCYRIAEPAWDDTHSTSYGAAMVDGWRSFHLCEWGGIARNYLKFDYSETGLGQVAYYDSWANLNRLHHRADHPLLFPLLTSLSFHLFGVHEWSARLIPLLSSTGLLLLVFWLGRKLGGERVGLIASFFFALFPVQVCYGTLPLPHLLGSFFSLLTFVFYLQWVERRETKYYAGIYVSFILGALSAWVTCFVVPAILLHYLTCEYKKVKSLNFVLFFALMPLVLFGLHLGCVYVLARGTWILEGLLDRFLMRTVSGGSAEGELVFTAWDFYARGYARAKLFLTPTVCLLSVAWFVNLLVTLPQKKPSRSPTASPELNPGRRRGVIHELGVCNLLNKISWRQDMFVLALFLFGLTHNLVFHNRTYLFDIMMFLHLTPFFAIAAALGTQFIVRKILQIKWIWTVSFALTICYSFSTQSASALEWLLNAPVLSEMYIVGSKVNEITDESAKVMSSFEPDFRMRYYSDREWSVMKNFNDLKSLMQAGPAYSHYILQKGGGRGTEKVLGAKPSSGELLQLLLV